MQALQFGLNHAPLAREMWGCCAGTSHGRCKSDGLRAHLASRLQKTAVAIQAVAAQGRRTSNHVVQLEERLAHEAVRRVGLEGDAAGLGVEQHRRNRRAEGAILLRVRDPVVASIAKGLWCGAVGIVRWGGGGDANSGDEARGVRVRRDGGREREA